MTSSDVQLIWSHEDKKQALTGAVYVKYLRFDESMNDGTIMLMVNSHGVEFVQNYERGKVEVRWGRLMDDPYKNKCVMSFLINRIKNVAVKNLTQPGIGMHDVESTIYFEVTADITIISHLFTKES
jgi:hypothetical protein